MRNPSEAIHPFLDGNSRVGRLLITLLLCERDSLEEPARLTPGEPPPPASGVNVPHP